LKNEEFENFNFRETDDNKFSSYVIGPKSPAIAGPILVPVEIIEKEVPNTHAFIWGWQAYRDVFGTGAVWPVLQELEWGC
jgi:hypothetical protein